jgi:hypothetical protein
MAWTTTQSSAVFENWSALSDKIGMLGNFDQDTRATNTDAPRLSLLDFDLQNQRGGQLRRPYLCRTSFANSVRYCRHQLRCKLTICSSVCAVGTSMESILG